VLGGIKSLHVKGSDSLSFKDYLTSQIILWILGYWPKGLHADIDSLKGSEVISIWLAKKFLIVSVNRGAQTLDFIVSFSSFHMKSENVAVSFKVFLLA
jgi:hypothetical protein